MKQYNATKTTVIISLGAVLEYYDFVIYGMMSIYLGALFFPQNDRFVSALTAFITFAIGYLVRPLGGMFFGMLADLKGRKQVLLIQTACVAFATLTIGLLPSYHSLGFAASIMLVLLRMLQGMSFGVELPGAITIFKESFHKSAIPFSFVISSTGIGATLASITLYLLSYEYNKHEILSFAWRIPFITGGILAFLVLAMRKYLNETPEFLSYKTGNTKKVIKLKTVFTDSYRKLIIGSLLCVFPTCLIIVNIFFPTYLSAYYQYPVHDVYFSISIGLIVGVIFSPFCGYIADHMNKIHVVVGSCLIFICLTPILHYLLLSKKVHNLVIFLILYQMIISALMTALFPILAQLFQTAIRFTAVAICYNFTYSLTTVSVALVSYILHIYNSQLFLFVFYILCAFVTLWGCFLYKQFIEGNRVYMNTVDKCN